MEPEGSLPVYKRYPPASNLSQINSVHTSTFYFSKVNEACNKLCHVYMFVTRVKKLMLLQLSNFI
jgi:hypothetical protein